MSLTSVKQLDTVGLFKCFDLRGNGWLGDEQGGGSLGKTPFGCDPVKGTNVGVIHGA